MRSVLKGASLRGQLSKKLSIRQGRVSVPNLRTLCKTRVLLAKTTAMVDETGSLLCRRSIRIGYVTTDTSQLSCSCMS